LWLKDMLSTIGTPERAGRPSFRCQMCMAAPLCANRVPCGRLDVHAFEPRPPPDLAIGVRVHRGRCVAMIGVKAVGDHSRSISSNCCAESSGVKRRAQGDEARLTWFLA
jgi:hypothetical protein